MIEPARSGGVRYLVRGTFPHWASRSLFVPPFTAAALVPFGLFMQMLIEPMAVEFVVRRAGDWPRDVQVY